MTAEVTAHRSRELKFPRLKKEKIDLLVTETSGEVECNGSHKKFPGFGFLDGFSNGLGHIFMNMLLQPERLHLEEGLNPETP